MRSGSGVVVGCTASCTACSVTSTGYCTGFGACGDAISHCAVASSGPWSVSLSWAVDAASKLPPPKLDSVTIGSEIEEVSGLESMNPEERSLETFANSSTSTAEKSKSSTGSSKPKSSHACTFASAEST
jgi:hypothetical protein